MFGKGKKTRADSSAKPAETQAVTFAKPAKTTGVKSRVQSRVGSRPRVFGLDKFLSVAPNRLELIRKVISTNNDRAAFMKGSTAGSCYLVMVEGLDPSLSISWTEAAKSNAYTDVTKVILSPEEYREVLTKSDRDAVETSGNIETQNEALRNWSSIMDEAILSGASDIHIFADPGTDCDIGFRIDGRIVTQSKFNRLSYLQIREAVLSAWNQNDRNHHTGDEKNWSSTKKVDTMFSHTTQSVQYDLRFQQSPHGKQNSAQGGFFIVLRITSKTSGDDFISLDSVGYSSYTMYWITRAVNRSEGLVLLAGTTGSGKSTSALGIAVYYKDVHPELSIQTIEDPVESVLGRHIPQMSVPAATNDNPTPHLDAVKAKLRQDPDAIYAGEMQGAEMAKVTTKAAITGHLVISTIHSSNSISIVERVIGEGGTKASLLTPGCYDVGITQKLVSRPCPACSRLISRSDDGGVYDEMAHVLGKRISGLRVAVAEIDCDTCKGTGFKGRVIAEEALPITEDIRNCYLRNDMDNLMTRWYETTIGLPEDGYYGRTLSDRVIFLATKGLVDAYMLHLFLGGDLFALRPTHPRFKNMTKSSFSYIFENDQSLEGSPVTGIAHA
jgi:type II secretory ATPase GspE/PulE/Tfp pilus assembly ATPase PilB-like protein